MLSRRKQNVSALFWSVNLSERGSVGNLSVDMWVPLEGVFEKENVKGEQYRFIFRLHKTWRNY